jgi:hypothetical protein
MLFFCLRNGLVLLLQLFYLELALSRVASGGRFSEHSFQRFFTLHRSSVAFEESLIVRRLVLLVGDILLFLLLLNWLLLKFFFDDILLLILLVNLVSNNLHFGASCVELSDKIIDGLIGLLGTAYVLAAN